MDKKFLKELRNSSPEEIASKLEERLNYAYLEIGDVSKIKVHNPLLDKKFDDKEVFVDNFIQYLRDPSNLWFVAKYLLNVNLLPIQLAILHQLWTKPFPMLIASRGASKTYLLTVYLAIRALLDQGCRIVVVGAGLRQSLILHNYLKNIWDNSPILQDICGKKNMPKRELHMCTWACGSSEVKFLPMGNGETIRGQRSTHLICDEFQSLDPVVFETVVRGFAAVKSQGLVESVEHEFRLLEMEKIGIINTKENAEINNKLSTSTNLGCNQIILSGTAQFQFNHLYKYYNYYRAIIESNGDKEFLRKNYPDLTISDDLNSSDYSLMRIPYDMLPMGMMDKAILSQGRATMNSVIFDMEYGCVFPKDSDGFFPASVLFNCNCPVKTIDDEINFSAMLSGDFSYPCIMGIDPASEQDKFAICIVENRNSHGRVIYQWSTNRKKYQQMKDKGLIDSSINDYHTFCIKHVRSLCKRFRIEMIVCDAGGGGHHLREGLKDLDKLDEGEKPIYDMDDETTLGNDGHYVLKMINFQNTEWKKEAHYGLKKDFSDRRILFPKLDLVTLVDAEQTESNISYEDLDQCCQEIEELQREIILIKHSMTPNGTEQWDVPRLKVIGADSIQEKLRRDRFTSLLLANWGRRLVYNEQNNNASYTMVGISTKGKNQNMDKTEIRYMNSKARRLRVLGESNGGGYDSLHRFS